MSAVSIYSKCGYARQSYLSGRPRREREPGAERVFSCSEIMRKHLRRQKTNGRKSREGVEQNVAAREPRLCSARGRDRSGGMRTERVAGRKGEGKGQGIV